MWLQPRLSASTSPTLSLQLPLDTTQTLPVGQHRESGEDVRRSLTHTYTHTDLPEHREQRVREDGCGWIRVFRAYV